MFTIYDRSVPKVKGIVTCPNTIEETVDRLAESEQILTRPAEPEEIAAGSVETEEMIV